MSWKIEETEIEAIATQTFPQQAVVSVISVVCFSGPPVSGRYDEGDYLDVWAAVDESLHAKSVVLYGCGTLSEDPNCPDWRDINELARCKTLQIRGRSVSVYRFSGAPVDEFVVRLTDSRGQTHYDNNGGFGVNYRLRRYQGLQVSCVRASNAFVSYGGSQTKRTNWILVFPNIVGVRGADGVARVEL
jgi:hypothetical protein